MRALPAVVCTAFLVTSSLLIAEQSSPRLRARSTHSHALHRHTVHHTRRSKPLASGNGVDIYNGNQKQTHVFNANTDPKAPAHNLTPAVIRVADAGSKTDHVVVGVSTDTRAGSENHPVVVNIASSGSSNQPVVLGVASSGFQTAGSVGPAAIAISPRPAKRPPYRPAALDRQ
jgi:hypothetical protein